MERRLKIRLLAISDKDREKGLMFSDPLADDECGLFVFDRPSKQSFWNFQVSFPIDVAFFDMEGSLIHVAQLEANQQKPVSSKGHNVKYVIETRKDWFKDHKISEGTKFWDLIDISHLKGR